MRLSNIRILFLQCVCIMVGSGLYAQTDNRVLSVYPKFASSVFNIRLNPPKGFTKIDESNFWAPNEGDKGNIFLYSFAFQSEDKECIVYYPRLDIYYQMNKASGWKQNVLYHDTTSIKVDHVFPTQLTMYRGEEATPYFRSDTIYFYDALLALPVRKIHPYFTGIYARKGRYADLYFKCLFTAEGYKKRDEYLKRICQAVNYKGGEWEYLYDSPTFSNYSQMISAAFDIQWKAPKEFKEVNMKNKALLREERLNALFSEAIFQSKDSACVIIYPTFESYVSTTSTLRKEIARDLKIDSIDKASSVTTLTGNEAKQIFNSDTVYVSPIPLGRDYKGRYPYCIGIYAYKKGHPAMTFKCFFTEEGKQNEDVYLNKLYKAVKYRHDDWTYDKEKEREEYYKMKIRANK